MKHEGKKHEGLLKKGGKGGFGKKAGHEKMADHVKSAKKY